MGAEDFAFMLQQRPGSYIWMGTGATAPAGRLHSPHYDFNDEALPLASATGSGWSSACCRRAERSLAERGVSARRSSL